VPDRLRRHIRIEEGRSVPWRAKAEYETIAHGRRMLVDVGRHLQGNDLCNRFRSRHHVHRVGDRLPNGAFERGLITTADTDGIELRWGSGEACGDDQEDWSAGGDRRAHGRG